MRKIVLHIFLLVTTCTLTAQSARYLHWQKLTTSEQLRNPSNSFLFKDSRDFLWIGSMSGLQRYDGFTIRDYGTFPIDSCGILGNNIQGQMVEDENQDLWVTTYQSLNHYDVETETFTPYPLKNEQGDLISGFHSCGKTDNTIWLLHRDSLRQFNISSKKFTASVSTKSTGYNRGVVRKFGATTLVYAYNLSGNLLTVFEFSEGRLQDTQKKTLDDSGIFSIYPISEDTLLIGAKDDLKEVIIGSSSPGQSILWQGKSLKTVTGISVFDKNVLSLATIDGNLFLYNRKKKEIAEQLDFSIFKASNPDNKIITALTDNDRNTWVSSRNDGIYYTQPDKIKFTNLLNGRVVTNLIQQKNGEIWAFTNKTILIINEKGETIRAIKFRRKNCDNMMNYYVINDRENRLWTNYYFSGPHFVKPDSDLFVETNISEYTYEALLLQDGRTIFSSIVEKGIFTVNEENNDSFSLIQISGTDKIIEASFLYQNPQREVIILEGNTKLTFYDPTDFSIKNSIAYSGAIYDMFAHPGDSVLWIGGANGLVSFNYNDSLLTYHSKESKLPNEVFGILPDDKGNLWLSSNSGIYRFNPTSNEIIAYNQADGTGSKRFSRKAHIKLKDGRLAFGGESGLIIFDPKNIKSQVPMAVPQITEILIDGKKRSGLKCENTGATNMEEIERLRLGPKDNKLEFHFVSKEYSNTAENQIRYRLSPEETEWQIAKSGGKCQYTNVEPGDYTFEIQAANSDGIWNTDLTDKLEIKLVPPFRKTWMFTLLVLCLVSIIVYCVATLYQIQKRKKEQAKFEKNMALETQRLRIARDMHDDLGSRLSAISLKTSMLETKFDNPEWKSEMEKLTIDAQQISITIRETIWAVDARNDSLGRLIHYLISYTEQLFDGLGLDYSFDIEKDLPEEQMVSGKIRRMVFLAYKEILNNIVKHAQANKVLIEMKMEKDHFILTITDDGVGFDLAEKEKGRGNGLDNMRYRMEKIDGTCQFLKVAKGTSIELNFDFLN